jgi:hypothetical protein
LEPFNHNIVSAHDDGHVATGPTLASQDVAAYDPIFWFFHANWDRLWWKWQQDTNATTLATFMSTLQGSSTWLKTPFNVLPPFSETADETIDLIGQFDVNYQHPQTAAPVAKLPLAAGSFSARGAISLADATMASVRVKGISRLDIPGSFTVHLMNDGETIARSGFFQPRSCSATIRLVNRRQLRPSPLDGAAVLGAVKASLRRYAALTAPPRRPVRKARRR